MLSLLHVVKRELNKEEKKSIHKRKLFQLHQKVVMKIELTENTTVMSLISQSAETPFNSLQSTQSGNSDVIPFHTLFSADSNLMLWARLNIRTPGNVVLHIFYPLFQIRIFLNDIRSELLQWLSTKICFRNVGRCMQYGRLVTLYKKINFECNATKNITN